MLVSESSSFYCRCLRTKEGTRRGEPVGGRREKRDKKTREKRREKRNKSTHERRPLLDDAEVSLIGNDQGQCEAVDEVRPEVELPDAVKQREAHLSIAPHPKDPSKSHGSVASASRKEEKMLNRVSSFVGCQRWSEVGDRAGEQGIQRYRAACEESDKDPQEHRVKRRLVWPNGAPNSTTWKQGKHQQEKEHRRQQQQRRQQQRRRQSQPVCCALCQLIRVHCIR